MGEIRNVYKMLVRKPKGKRPLWEDLGADGRIILDWILQRDRVGKCRLDSGYCEHYNELWVP
jgi:hypothetical protein